ncbi:MAG: hypothetical protein DRG83_02965 [Deltaproteobacteria bacterium]|nr:MAG: hypothetical protein DRG83_02965 [Deltaproteobacteria bacterium]
MGWLVRKLSSTLDSLTVLFAWIASLLLAFSVLAVCVDVVLRYFFNRPIGWVLQVTEYILLYIPFLAATWVLREEAHVKVDLLVNRLSPRIQLFLNFVTSIIGALVMLALSYYGLQVTVDFYIRNVPTLEYYKIPEWIVLLAIPMGSSLMFIQFLRRAYKSFKVRGSLRKKGEYPHF